MKDRLFRLLLKGAAFLLFPLLFGCGEVSYLEEAPMETERAEAVSSDTETEEVLPETAFVYVCGEVACPGVYEMPSGSRIYQVIERAGGLTEQADAAALNQAEPVSDGMMAYIPAIGEALSTAAEPADGRINLNTASREELLTLPGIGASKADAILSYREDHGGFQDIRDLMNITGIKEGVFGKLKEKVRV